MSTKESDDASTWPNWFPIGCPPPEAIAAQGRFFRLVSGVDITEDDFKSHGQMVAEGLKARRWPVELEIRAAACSVHADLEDAKTARGSSGPLRKKLIAQGDVNGGGRLLHTPTKGNSHHSWWRDVGDIAWKTFEVAQS